MLIRVGVTKPKDRATYQLVWIDPKTRKQRRRSSGERRKREAEDQARKLERELNAGLGARAWPDFRTKYEAEHLSSLAVRTFREWRSIEARLVKELDPVWVRDIDEAALATYARRLRDAGASEDTIAKHLRTIGAALRRAAAWKIIPVAPTIAMPRRAKGRRKMKGRPLSAEEFDRMLKATPDVVGTKRAASWRRLLRGLWLSGFRLSEALEFWWDDTSRICVWDLSARRPTMVIHAELEKGARDRPHFPLTPDFAEWLRRTPEPQRTGPVFAPISLRGSRVTRSPRTVSRVISEIGKEAGIVVSRSPKSRAKTTDESDATHIKFASAHDLRRAFGSRWAIRVKPAVLKELMRHSSVETTMSYYVQLDGEELADAIWDGYQTATSESRDKRCEQFREHPSESDATQDAETARPRSS